MTAAEIMEGKTALRPTEQAEAIASVRRLDAHRMLSGEELAALAAEMLEANSPAEKQRLRSALTRGFYGGPADA